MFKIISTIGLLLIANCALSQDLKYYLPDSVSYDQAVPKPKDIIHHEVGEWHVTHDRLVSYMKAIAAAVPTRVKLETMGFTYEGRPQVLLIITSPANHQRLEEIRQQHIKLTDPSTSSSLNIDNMPVVVWIGHSIHGNEASGSNASLVSAYHLAAAKGSQIDNLLENTIILVDPSFNPDGLQRFSSWVNQHKSKNLVTDANSREFNEAWPGGRFNHYWFDLNRDWLPAVHVESQNRLEWYHKWKPNILTDHHEQGSNATFFFQPGVPSRVNPLTPAKNQELTAKLGKYHAAYLDKIGSLYFTKESYDDFYYGKGSTYPDINGAIGILFEQASSRGHLQQTINGELSFPHTIRNQFVTALSTLEGARQLRKEFLSYQRDFYKNSISEAVADPVKAYVFGNGHTDMSRTQLFLKMLHRHGIKTYTLKNDLVVAGNKFLKNTDMIIPLDQPQYKVIRTMFEKTFDYKDSLFYDITSWTMPLAFGLNHAELKGSVYNKELLAERSSPVGGHLTGIVGGKTNYGYLVRWTDYYAPALLNKLQQAGILVKVATSAFQMTINGTNESFPSGTLFIPVQMQTLSTDEVFEKLSAIAQKNEMQVQSISTGGVNAGVDLGSSKFVVIPRQTIAMITGPGVNATDAGEIWHLLDQRMNIPATHLEPAVFNRVEMNKYTTLIMVGGSYNEINKEKLKAWVQGGGVLILTEEAVTWAAQNGISDVKFKRARPAIDSMANLSYSMREQVDGAQQIQGAIFGAGIDLAHPLSFGYSQNTVSMFKANRVFMEKSKNPYGTPLFYGSKPLQSGWVSRENADAIKNSAAVVVNTVGNGRVINIADNPNFRAFWLGGTKLFMNAIFFGKIIDAASGRTAD